MTIGRRGFIASAGAVGASTALSAVDQKDSRPNNGPVGLMQRVDQLETDVATLQTEVQQDIALAQRIQQLETELATLRADVQRSIVVLTHGTYGVGSIMTEPVAVPTGAMEVNFRLDRAQYLNPAVTADIFADLSLDGGLTWASTNPGPATGSFPIGAGTVGGVVSDKRGLFVRFSSLGTSMPQPTNPDRRIRIIVAIAGGPLTTMGTLMFS